MSALPSLSGVAPSPAPSIAPAPAPSKLRARGFLHIVRHGAGPNSLYVLTYHRLESTPLTHFAGGSGDNGQPDNGHEPPSVIRGEAKALSSVDRALPEPDARPKPILAEGAQALIDILERIGVDFSLENVRGALEDILRLGSANIPDLWLSDDDLLAKGLAENL
jgi:hypothetical protein